MEKNVIKCIKGFDKDLKCKGFQYEIGKEYETPYIEMCKHGFHAIDETESPLSVFKYYPPCCSDGTLNRFCFVELSGKTIKQGNKTVGSKIKIVTEIGIEGVIDLQREWTKVHSVNDADSFKHGDYSLAGNTGYSSVAANTGNYSVLTNTGNYSVVANTGACSLVDNEGFKSSTNATGNYSASVNTGNYSSATNTGDCSLVANTGDASSASNTGNYSSASNTGIYSSASNTGNYSSATNTGLHSSAINNGHRSLAGNKGKCSSAFNTGDDSSAINTGNYSYATNTGDDSSAEVYGKDSIAAVFGKDCMAKGALGCALVLTERGDWDNDMEGYPIKNIVAVIVDGVKVKADTWYMLVDGKLKECK